MLILTFRTPTLLIEYYRDGDTFTRVVYESTTGNFIVQHKDNAFHNSFK